MPTDEEKKAQEIQEQAEREAKEKAAKDNPPVDAGSTPSSDGEGQEEADGRSPLEEARELDKSIKSGNAEFRKLVERQEKAAADSQIAGKGFAIPPQAPQRSAAEQASRDKIKKYGNITGAGWAKDMEKEDANL